MLIRFYIIIYILKIILIELINNYYNNSLADNFEINKVKKLVAR